LRKVYIQFRNNNAITTFKEVVKMKWNILFAILAVLILVGCAKPVAEKPAQPVIPQEETPVVEEPVAEETPVQEEVVQEEAKPVATTETIMLSDSAAEPATLKVAAGSIIIFKNTGDKVKIIQVKKIEFNERSPRLEKEDTWEIKLGDAGEYQFLDVIIGKAKGTITVE
jgi:plastocyanin